MIYKLIWVCLFPVISFGCYQSSVEIIEAEELKELQSAGVVVIDIRTPKEYEGGHIPDVVHINYHREDFMDAIAGYKNQPVVVYCAAGGRSSRASERLTHEGFSKIYNYVGGFSDWKKLGEQIEK